MRSSFDWDNATVVVRVPVHHTATCEVQEYELHIAQLAELVAGQLRVEGDALVAPSAIPVPLSIEPTPL